MQKLPENCMPNMAQSYRRTLFHQSFEPHASGSVKRSRLYMLPQVPCYRIQVRHITSNSQKVPGRLDLFKVFIGTVRHFFASAPSRLGQYSTFKACKKCCTALKTWLGQTRNFGTVQHFCNPRVQKCCTVPKHASCRSRSPGFQDFCISFE